MHFDIQYLYEFHNQIWAQTFSPGQGFLSEGHTILFTVKREKINDL